MNRQEQESVFEAWISQHKGLLFKVVRAYAFTAMDRDDLFQEITIQVWHSVLAFKGESAVTTWIYRVALNTAMKWVGREKKHEHGRETLDHVTSILQENKFQVDERLTWLYEEISKLDEIDRSIVLLLLDDFSYKEMSTLTGLSESNVGVRINRIKKYLVSQSKQN